MNYWLKFMGVFWSESGFVSGGDLTHSWTQRGLGSVSHPPRGKGLKLKPSAETRSLQDKCPRLSTETAPRTSAGAENILWSCWSHQKVGQEGDSCHNSCLTLANIQKYQTDLLVEIFQRADWLPASAAPAGREGLSLGQRGKGKPVATRAEESL